MLTEARPLGFDGDTLVVGHNTGALADRINAANNNADIVAVFEEKLGTRIGVRCVVGTDPAAANVRPAPRKEVWAPQPAREETPKRPEPARQAELEHSEPAEAPARERTPQQAAERAKAPEPPNAPQQPERQDVQAPSRPAAPAQPQPRQQDEERASESIPPPPEPFDDAPPEYSREDEERDMAPQAREEGSRDRRDAAQVAFDLLAAELGARPL
ncbi:hypothetical protein JKI95_06125 [Corynebacterium aquatimens]|nr:hypothetical protein [Corynebacterium aquatimens]QYH18930.1 hypothetical protein JKI95_06125 [Corynebacterium aquatimens]